MYCKITFVWLDSSQSVGDSMVQIGGNVRLAALYNLIMWTPTIRQSQMSVSVIVMHITNWEAIHIMIDCNDDIILWLYTCFTVHPKCPRWLEVWKVILSAQLWTNERYILCSCMSCHAIPLYCAAPPEHIWY